MNRLMNTWHYLRNNGVIPTLKHALYRMSELKNDRYFGIETNNDVKLETLGIHNGDSAQYSPISYAALKLALREVEPLPENEAFLDYGAGKGRVLIVAATLPFRRIVGVEFAPELVSVARHNIKHARYCLTDSNIEILERDATEYDVPANISVIHFYNPFIGNTLSTVTENIASSLRANPRQMTILFANPDDFERILQEENRIPREWIIKTKDIPWPYFKQDAPYSNSYRIYSLDSRKPANQT